jgi:hypothetical protein
VKLELGDQERRAVAKSLVERTSLRKILKGNLNMRKHMRKAFIVTSTLMGLTGVARADCSWFSPTGADGYVNYRAAPSLNADVLWTTPNVGNGSDPGGILWCGRSVTDVRGTKWLWVAFKLKRENWIHKAWVSRRVVSLYIPPPTNEGRSVAPSFEEGGE